jgi:competence protein ComEC
MKKIVYAAVLIGLLFVGFWIFEYARFNDGKLHVVFCNVGQGDAIFIRTPKGLDFLIDGGPDNSLLSCLSSHMPFWDRTIEMVFLTHPHTDHMRGLVDVLRMYKVKNFTTIAIQNDIDLYRELIKQIGNERVEIKDVFRGDKFTTKDGVEFKIMHPTQNFLKTSAPGAQINEASELVSLVIHVSYKGNDIILTGDSETLGFKEAISGNLPSIEVLQIPHHGSRFGADMEVIQKLNPRVAVISVGRNKYGHPSREVLEILKVSNTKILRTDLDGEIHLTF